MPKKSKDMEMHGHCCRGFPAAPVVLLIFALLWMLSDLSIIALKLPWVPILLTLVSLKMIIVHSCMCRKE